MGGITSSGGEMARFNPRERTLKYASYQRQLTEDYLWWVNKRNEIAGQMLEDVDFRRYVMAYKDANSPHIEVDKEYLEKAVDFINTIEDEMDDEILKDYF